MLLVLIKVENTKSDTRTINVTRNISYGLMQIAVSIVLPFIVRTILIYRFGAGYLGLDSLFTSVLSVLSIAELGFSTAIVYSMYKPAAENNKEKICAYLSYYRKIYRLIGLLILGIGLLLIPILPNLVHDETMPGNINLYFCYLIFLGDSVIDYLMFGYMTAIPIVFQRKDVVSRIVIIASLFKCILQSMLLLTSGSYYLYLLAMPFVTICRNLLTASVVRMKYPWMVCSGELVISEKRNLYKRVYGLFINKLFSVSRNGIDSICISAFIGLALTGIYNNYLMVLMGLNAVCGVIAGSMMPSVGNSIATESPEKNYNDMRNFDFLYMAGSGWLTTCLLCMFQPFMKLWVGENLMLGMPEVIGLCAIFYVMRMGDMRWVYHEGAGLWWECRHIAIAEAIANVILNIVLCRYLGVLGIILATVLSLFFINYLLCPVILFRFYFKNDKIKEYHIDYFQYLLTMIISAWLSWWTCENLIILKGLGNNPIIMCIINLILAAATTTAISLVVFLIIWHKSNRFNMASNWIRLVLKMNTQNDNTQIIRK